MAVNVTINEYLQKLKSEQLRKPNDQRLSVPTVEELAQAAGASKTGFIDFTHNRPRGINRLYLDATIKVLREYGHSPTVQDLIRWTE